MTARLPRQERLHSCSWHLVKTEFSHILLRKKPAARHLFQPLVFSFVSIINVQTNRLPKKFKAALQKRHPITLINSRDHYSRSKYTTQVLFSHTHGLFSGFLRCKNSCRNPFKIRQLLREVGYWVVRSFLLANIPSVRVSEKLFIYLHNYSIGGIGGITTNIDFNSSIVPALTHSDIPFFHTKLSALN